MTTVAILSLGEMGTAVAKRLQGSGVHVVSCSAGRSAATARRGQEAGIACLPSLDDVVRQAEAIISLVTPFGATPLAHDVANAMEHTGCRPLFVDGNAIGPSTALDIAGIIGPMFVDGCIIGTARELAGHATFYLSGQRAREAAEIIEPAVRTEILGDQASQASGFKILYAGLTKGMSALGAELLLAADRLGLFEQIFAKYQADHPGVATFFQHTLPGLPPRSARRSQEMHELASTLEGLGLTAYMAHGAEQALAMIAEQFTGDDGAAEWQRLLQPAVGEMATGVV